MTTLYAFDRSSKYWLFTGLVNQQLDAISGEPISLRNATNIELIPEKAGHQRYFKDDAWHYVVDNTGTDYWLADGSKHTITELGKALPEGALLEEPPKPEPTFEQRLASTIAQREAAYKTESDPLYMEWQYDQTDEAEQKWRDKVAEIKERYPLPTE
jgi:hypothetical protein